MDPVLRATLTSWDLRFEVILVLALAGAIFYLGWWRLRARTKSGKGSNRWRVGAAWKPVVYLGALVLLGITLMSPIDVLSARRCVPMRGVSAPAQARSGADQPAGRTVRAS